MNSFGMKSCNIIRAVLTGRNSAFSKVQLRAYMRNA